MKVLDATFLIDYLDGKRHAIRFLEGHSNERFVLPAPAFAEVLVGEGNEPGETDVEVVREYFAWGEVVTADEESAITGMKIADEIGPEGPYLDGCDALIVAVGLELDAPVVSSDRDLTHPETKQVVDVEEY